MTMRPRLPLIGSCSSPPTTTVSPVETPRVGDAMSRLSPPNALRLPGKITADELAVRTSDLLRRDPV